MAVCNRFVVLYTKRSKLATMIFDIDKFNCPSGSGPKTSSFNTDTVQAIVSVGSSK